MRYFATKPRTVEAIQFRDSKDGVLELIDFLGEDREELEEILELVEEGDYIIADEKCWHIVLPTLIEGFFTELKNSNIKSGWSDMESRLADLANNSIYDESVNPFTPEDSPKFKGYKSTTSNGFMREGHIDINSFEDQIQKTGTYKNYLDPNRNK